MFKYTIIFLYNEDYKDYSVSCNKLKQKMHRSLQIEGTDRLSIDDLELNNVKLTEDSQNVINL